MKTWVRELVWWIVLLAVVLGILALMLRPASGAPLPSPLLSTIGKSPLPTPTPDMWAFVDPMRVQLYFPIVAH